MGCGGSGHSDGKEFATDGKRVLLPNFSAEVYVIGACTNEDDGQTNVDSRLARDGRLGSPSGVCPGAPFSIAVTELGDKAVQVDFTIGPLPVQYASLTTPLEFPQMPDDRYEVDSNTSPYSAIPLFPVGNVGAVYRQGTPPEATALIQGSGVRRTFLSPAYSRIDFIRNNFTGTNTLEPRFGDLHAGAILHASERIEVLN